MEKQKSNDEGKRSYMPRKGLRWIFVLFGLVLGVIFILTLHRAVLRKKVVAKLEGIRGQGYPVTFEELDDWLEEVPAEENAALVLQQAFDNYVLGGDDRFTMLPEVMLL